MAAIPFDEITNQKLKDSDLIRRILGGEKELYEILVRRNNQKLYRVVRSYLKADPEIEDVMQNSYLRAYEKLHQFKLNAAFSTWLIRIAINEALARLKEKGRVYHLWEDDHSKAHLQKQENYRLNPQERMMRREARELLENAIDRLDLKYRTVYILKEVEEMQLSEIAEILELTVSNVKVRLHRAKKMLKEILYALSSDKDVFPFGFDRCDRLTESVMQRLN